MPRRDVDVSIVIVSYNTADLLDQCLRSVDDHAGDVSLEIFVVDNASTDRSADIVAERFPHVTLIRNRRNVGFAAANNEAIRRSTGRYVLLLNPDTIVLDGAIAKTVAFMDRQPLTGIATSKVLNADGTFQTCYGDRFPSLWMLVTGGTSLRTAIASALMNERYRRTSGVREDRIERAHPVAWVMGAYLMIRRAVLDQIGLLDEALFMYGEEPDLCYRAYRAGWQRWYTPDGEIVHLGGQSTDQVDARKVSQWLMASSFHFFRKHRGRRYVAGCWCVALAQALVKIPLFGALAAMPAGELKQRRRRHKLAHLYHCSRWLLRHSPGQLMTAPTTPSIGITDPAGELEPETVPL